MICSINIVKFKEALSKFICKKDNEFIGLDIGGDEYTTLTLNGYEIKVITYKIGDVKKVNELEKLMWLKKHLNTNKSFVW